MVFKGTWFILAVSCLFLAAMIDLTKKYILDKNFFKPNELVIYTTMGIGFFGLIHFFCDKKCRSPKKLNSKLLLLLLFLGFIGYSFSIAFTHSIKLSPDVTLVGMIVSLNIILLYLVSSIFFETSPKFNFDVLFALILIIIGINIISKKF
tara:strand:+ start:79 stop:528 length:450 start_codon:yes stop_codon:yes gene_type:complete